MPNLKEVAENARGLVAFLHRRHNLLLRWPLLLIVQHLQAEVQETVKISDICGRAKLTRDTPLAALAASCRGLHNNDGNITAPAYSAKLPVQLPAAARFKRRIKVETALAPWGQQCSTSPCTCAGTAP